MAPLLNRKWSVTLHENDSDHLAREIPQRSATHHQSIRNQHWFSQTNASFVVTWSGWDRLTHSVRLVICLIIKNNAGNRAIQTTPIKSLCTFMNTLCCQKVNREHTQNPRDTHPESIDISPKGATYGEIPNSTFKSDHHSQGQQNRLTSPPNFKNPLLCSVTTGRRRTVGIQRNLR